MADLGLTGKQGPGCASGLNRDRKIAFASRPSPFP